MKIGFLAPIEGINQYGTTYLSIVGFLQKKGHDVVHPLSYSEAKLTTWTPQEREHSFQEYYEQVTKSTMIIAECSYPCINLGYEISNIIQQGKEVIVLKVKNHTSSLKNFDSLYTKKHIYIYEYQPHDLLETVEEALAYNPSQKYKKYNILFTPAMVAKLNAIAKKKTLPKSVYIRQLLEKGLASDE